MDVKNRITAIRLTEKLGKKGEFAKRIGVTVRWKERSGTGPGSTQAETNPLRTSIF